MQKRSLLLSLLMAPDLGPERGHLILVAPGGRIRESDIDLSETDIKELLSTIDAQAAAIRYGDGVRTFLLAVDGAGLEGLESHAGQGWRGVGEEDLWDQGPARALLAGMSV